MAACGSGEGPGADDDSVEILGATESMRDFGDYIIYFNAITTDQLDADIAGEYEIVRSTTRAMLTFSVRRKGIDGASTAVRSDVSSSAVNLTGQIKTVLLREISEGDAIYYIGELDIFDRETLIYTINVTPTGESDSLSLRYQKQFFVDA